MIGNMYKTTNKGEKRDRTNRDGLKPPLGASQDLRAQYTVEVQVRPICRRVELSNIYKCNRKVKLRSMSKRSTGTKKRGGIK